MNKSALLVLLIVSSVCKANVSHDIAAVVCSEAGGATRLDQELVAHSIVNRSKYREYGTSIQSVIHRNRQYARGRICSNFNLIQDLVEKILSGQIKDSYNVLYFHGKVRKPYWAKRFKLVKITKAHYYYTK